MRGLLLAATMLLTLAPASAIHCDAMVSPSPEIDMGTHYVETDLCQPDCIMALWVYEESNGIAGLQRGDNHWDDNHCGIRSDTILAEVDS